MMQLLIHAHVMDGQVTREPQADSAAVDTVLTAGRSMIAVAMKSLGVAAEETTVAQYRALEVLASRNPQRVIDLAAALGVAPSTAGRMCDRLVRNGLVRRQRARGDRRAVLVCVTQSGQQVVDEVTGRHRALIADILGRLPAAAQRTVARAFLEFADAAGEVLDGQRPEPMTAGPAPVPGPRPPVRQDVPGPRPPVRQDVPVQPAGPVRASARERA
jgi:DNA-binding MarR family transcriptional regulator